MKVGRYVAIDPTANVADDCDIDDYVSIRSHARVGNRVVIKCRATISRECTVGDDCFIGPHSIMLNGREGKASNPSHLGDHVFLGACACVLPGVRVCKGATVGAGAVVIRDITESSVYVGNPCRRVRG